MKKLVFTFALSALLFVFWGCEQAGNFKAKIDSVKQETTEAIDNVHTEIKETKEEIEYAVDQITGAADSLQEASQQTTEALNDMNAAFDAIGDIGGDSSQ